MTTLVLSTWIHKKFGEVRWSYTMDDNYNKPERWAGSREGGTSWLAPLWACTDALRTIPSCEKIWLYVDSEYVAEGLHDRSLRRLPDVSETEAALLESAWQELDGAVARREEEVTWCPYHPEVVLTCHRVMKMSRQGD